MKGGGIATQYRGKSESYLLKSMNKLKLNVQSLFCKGNMIELLKIAYDVNIYQ